MGLIKAAFNAVGSTLEDQLREAIRCDEMGNDILMIKKTTPSGVISNNSTVIVGPGQCAIIYDNGRIVDATAEEGIYTYDNSSTPSLFAGQFGGMFKEMWQRFTYNGATAKEQAVYFFNLKEIIGNKFGTPNPVPYKDWGHPIMNARTNSYIAMSVKVKCFGTYTIEITDPFLFMFKIAGLSDIYTKESLVEQIRSEVVGAFSNVMNGLGSDAHKIEVLELPNKTNEIKEIMEKEVFDKPIRDRGIRIVSFVVESLTLDDESNEKIDNYEIGGDSYQQQGVLTGSYAKALENAASNSNGTAHGIMGIGMMNIATNGMNMGSSFNNAKPMEPNPSALKNGAKCINCGADVSGKFCSECGTKVEETSKKFCSNCGNEVAGKFCTNCGTKAE